MYLSWNFSVSRFCHARNRPLSLCDGCGGSRPHCGRSETCIGTSGVAARWRAGCRVAVTDKTADEQYHPKWAGGFWRKIEISMDFLNCLFGIHFMHAVSVHDTAPHTASSASCIIDFSASSGVFFKIPDPTCGEIHDPSIFGALKAQTFAATSAKSEK